MSVSRNDPCPCGSGQKYKRCCGQASGRNASSSSALAPSSIEVDQLVALFHAGRFADLETRASRLLEKFPKSGLVWKLLCAALQMQGKNALQALRAAAKLLPDDPETQNNLGLALQDAGEIEAAVAAYRHALKVEPNNAEVWNSLGTAQHDLGAIDDAIASYKNALKINPAYAIGHKNIGISYQERGMQEHAITSYRRALEIQPDYAEVYWNLGVTLGSLGQLDDALASHRRALEIKPDYLPAKRSFLAALLYHPEITVEELFENLTRFAEQSRPALQESVHSFRNRPDAHRKLRIGYVSSDFRYHPVARNVTPLIEGADRERFDIYLYGNVQKPDSVTARFQSTVTAWRSILNMSDKDAAAIIRNDEIDILVLLAGRFDENRPLIAEYRAAPVQVSFHDPVSSGLKSMDYLITDGNLSPRDTKEKFTERLVRLPTFYLHPPLGSKPEVSSLPARDKKYVTFGSFNNLTKVNKRVVALWAQVLHAVPESRLILKFQDAFRNQRLRQHFLDLFMGHGIDAHRIDLISVKDMGEQHMARYAEIDIALDPFPFTGSTTTFEALWMGVPVVTLMGDHMVARWSGAMLKKIGLQELIANSESEYVDIAQGLAQNLDRLEALRLGLRERVASSPLCDEKRRTRQIERAFRWMWSKWCASEQPH